MAENTHTLRLIMEVVNRTDKTLKEVGQQVTSLSGLIQKGGQEISKNLTAMGGLGSLVAGFVPQIAAGVAAYASFATVLNTVEAGVKKVITTLEEGRAAWAEQNQANLQLQAVWASMGRTSPVEDIKKLASELQNVSKFADEAILQGAKMLGTFPAITAEEFPKAMKTMVDFAAFSGTSIEHAALNVGRASMGMVGALQRQGITISEVAKKSQNFGLILEDINKQIEGQAAVMAGTWGGQWARLSNAWNDVLESIGRIQTSGLGGVLDPIIERFRTWAEMLEKGIDTGKFDPLIAAIRTLAERAADASLKIIDFAAETAVAFGEGLQKPEFLENLTRIGDAMQSLANATIGAAKAFASLAGLLKIVGQAIPAFQSLNEIFALSIWAGKGTKKGSLEDSIKIGPGLSKQTDEVIAERDRFDQNMAQFMSDMGVSLSEVEAQSGEKISESVHKWYEKIESAKQQGQKTGSPFGITPDEIKKTQELLIKESEAYYERVQGLDKVFRSEQKAAIAETTQSEIIAKQKEAAIDAQASQAKLRILEESNARTTSLREGAHQAMLAQIAMISQPDKQSEALRKEEDRYTTEKIEAEKKYSAALIDELDAQLKKRQELSEKIRQLDAQATTERAATQDALKQVTLAASSEYDKLKINMADASAKLREAVSLLPSMPERAMELAKQAQSAFAALGQQVDQLKNDLKSSAEKVADAQRAIATSGLTGTAKWRAEIQDVQKTIQRGRAEEAAGRLKEAKKYYDDAVGQAKSIASSAPEGQKSAGRQIAAQLVDRAGEGLTRVGSRLVAQAEVAKEEQEFGINKAGDVIQQALEAQKTPIQKNIEALDRNTAAIQGELEQRKPSTLEAEKRGLASQKTPEDKVDQAEKYRQLSEAARAESTALQDQGKFEEAAKKATEALTLFDKSQIKEEGPNSAQTPGETEAEARARIRGEVFATPWGGDAGPDQESLKRQDELTEYFLKLPRTGWHWQQSDLGRAGARREAIEAENEEWFENLKPREERPVFGKVGPELPPISAPGVPEEEGFAGPIDKLSGMLESIKTSVFDNLKNGVLNAAQSFKSSVQDAVAPTQGGALAMAGGGTMEGLDLEDFKKAASEHSKAADVLMKAAEAAEKALGQEIKIKVAVTGGGFTTDQFA